MTNLDGFDETTLPESEELTANAAAHEMLAVLFRQPELWADVYLTDDEIPRDWRTEFVAMRRIHERGADLTRALLAEELKALTGWVDGLNDRRIAPLTMNVGSAKNLPEYQRVIRRAAELERLGRIRAELDQHIRRGDAAAGLAALNRALSAAPRRGEREALRDVMWRVFEALDKPEPPISLGMTALDRMLAGGLRPGEVMVLAARPGVGKSALALQFILHVGPTHGPVALWSLEMSQEQWARRAIGHRAMVDSARLRTGDIRGDEYPRIAEAAAFLRDANIHFASTSDTTPEGWSLEAASAVRELGAKLLVVDYLGLMAPPKDAWSRENEVATHSRNVKRTALQLGVPVILLHQLNREAQDKAPTLRNLRESGAVEQDADQVLFIHRDLDSDTHVLRNQGMLILAKQRDGETGVIPIEYEPGFYRFVQRTAKEPPPEVATSSRNGRRWGRWSDGQ